MAGGGAFLPWRLSELELIPEKRLSVMLQYFRGRDRALYGATLGAGIAVGSLTGMAIGPCYHGQGIGPPEVFRGALFFAPVWIAFIAAFSWFVWLETQAIPRTRIVVRVGVALLLIVPVTAALIWFVLPCPNVAS